MEDVPEANRWNLSAVYEIERDRIRDWLRAEANQRLIQNTSVEAGEAARTAKELEATFATTILQPDPDLLAAAHEGRFRREAPSERRILLLGLLTVFLMVAEVFVFLAVFARSMDATERLSEIITRLSPLLLQAGALAAAGYIVGLGLCDLLMPAAFRATHEARGFAWAFFLGGLGIVGLIAYMRSDGTADAGAAIAVTTMLALGVTVCGAGHRYDRTRQATLQGQMYSAQLQYATKVHADEFSGNVWKDTFQQIVGETTSRRDRVFTDAANAKK